MKEQAVRYTVKADVGRVVAAGRSLRLLGDGGAVVVAFGGLETVLRWIERRLLYEGLGWGKMTDCCNLVEGKASCYSCWAEAGYPPPMGSNQSPEAAAKGSDHDLVDHRHPGTRIRELAGMARARERNWQGLESRSVHREYGPSIRTDEVRIHRRRPRRPTFTGRSGCSLVGLGATRGSS